MQRNKTNVQRKGSPYPDSRIELQKIMLSVRDLKEVQDVVPFRDSSFLVKMNFDFKDIEKDELEEMVKAHTTKKITVEKIRQENQQYGFIVTIG